MRGIYFIKNCTSEKLYIGLSTNVENRLSYHKRRLQTGKHKNEHLQNAWKNYGEESFEFGIIEECSEEILPEREKFWISFHKSHDREFGYNKTYGGEFGRLSNEIVQRTAAILRTRTISAEQRDQISKTLSGIKQPKELVDRRAKSCRKCDDETENEIARIYLTRAFTGEEFKNLAESLGTTWCAAKGALKRKGIKYVGTGTGKWKRKR